MSLSESISPSSIEIGAFWSGLIGAVDGRGGWADVGRSISENGSTVHCSDQRVRSWKPPLCCGPFRCLRSPLSWPLLFVGAVLQLLYFHSVGILDRGISYTFVWSCGKCRVYHFPSICELYLSFQRRKLPLKCISIVLEFIVTLVLFVILGLKFVCVFVTLLKQ